MQPYVMIDVRSPAEYAAGHLAGALHIPYEQIERGVAALPGVDLASPLLLYCQSGARSAVAASRLTRAGYTQVVDGGSLSRLLIQIKGTIAKAVA